MLAKHSGAYFEYGAEWASLFGNGREILVPLCFVISNKKPERDINLQIEYDFDKRLECIKPGNKVQNVTICRPFGIVNSLLQTLSGMLKQNAQKY